MSVLPRSNTDLLQFATDHLEAWGTPAAIGLTAAQLSELTTRYDAAIKDFNAASLARETSRAATTTMTASMGRLRDQLAAMIRSIKTFAEASPDPLYIYGLAQVPPPAPPTPATAPGKATNFAVNLQPSGSVTLSWDAPNAAASSGAVFVVARKLPGQSTFTNVGFSSGSTIESRRMSYTDATIPASAASAGAQYIVTGHRGPLIGESSDAIVVQFGVDGAGATVASLAIAA